MGFLLGCDDESLIIRKIDDHYVLVGNSYVYGIINEEMAKTLRDASRKRRISCSVLWLYITRALIPQNHQIRQDSDLKGYGHKSG